ncbi:phosphodiesterase [Streptomyces asoensis]|uniref:phosphodiesterase n=1 Tax=Streptomyces asoensis TaxID=249586 RepID=UPI00340AF96F
MSRAEVRESAHSVAAAYGGFPADTPSAGVRRWNARGARRAGPVEAAFRLLSALRRAPALHPRGLTCTAALEVIDDGGGPWGAPWLDVPGVYTATVRFSRAAGLPDAVPDGLGLALRVERADGHGVLLDLLLTTSGRGRLTRHLPRPRTDALGGPYSSLLAYRIGGRQRLVAAFPHRTRQTPVPAAPGGLRDALAAGPLVFELCAETSGRTWRPFAVLTVDAALSLPADETLDFDPYGHSAHGFRPGGALAAIRSAAYRGSRAGRRTRTTPHPAGTQTPASPRPTT